MKIADVQARVVVVRAWAIDHEEYAKAHKAEDELWKDVLEAIANGADQPAQLAKAALSTLLVAYPRGHK